MLLSIGLMSGTSMDGIDAALVETDGRHHIRSLGHVSLHYDPAFNILLKAAEYAVRTYPPVILSAAKDLKNSDVAFVHDYNGDLTQAADFYPQALEDYCTQILQLSTEALAKKTHELKQYLYHDTQHKITLQDVIQHSTDLHANAIFALLKKTGHHANEIDVVGYHGQTLFHQPACGISVIVGDGQALAKKIHITVVNDFRRQDIDAGGQGAPFAPIYHHALAMRDHKIPCVVINIGGIANVTLITHEDENALIGFDTGPGNVLLDRLIKKRTHGRAHMDKNGQYGKRGGVNAAVLKSLFEKAVIKNGQNYLTMPAPKSLDTHDCIDISELETLSLEDACATLETFTAQSIVKSVVACSHTLPLYWIVAGGGAYNPVIIDALKNHVQKLNSAASVLTADQVGWSIQGMEAELFAYLAVRSLQHQPLSFPGTTGVPEPMTGGMVHKIN